MCSASPAKTGAKTKWVPTTPAPKAAAATKAAEAAKTAAVAQLGNNNCVAGFNKCVNNPNNPHPKGSLEAKEWCNCEIRTNYPKCRGNSNHPPLLGPLTNNHPCQYNYNSSFPGTFLPPHCKWTTASKCVNDNTFIGGIKKGTTNKDLMNDIQKAATLKREKAAKAAAAEAHKAEVAAKMATEEANKKKRDAAANKELEAAAKLKAAKKAAEAAAKKVKTPVSHALTMSDYITKTNPAGKSCVYRINSNSCKGDPTKPSSASAYLKWRTENLLPPKNTEIGCENRAKDVARWCGAPNSYKYRFIPEKTCSNSDTITCPNNDCPSGTYSQSCPACTYKCRDEQLDCTCKNEIGSHVNTTLNNVKKTNKNISNCNGDLVVGVCPPPRRPTVGDQFHIKAKAAAKPVTKPVENAAAEAKAKAAALAKAEAAALAKAEAAAEAAKAKAAAEAKAKAAAGKVPVAKSIVKPKPSPPGKCIYKGTSSSRLVAGEPCPASYNQKRATKLDCESSRNQGHCEWIIDGSPIPKNIQKNIQKRIKSMQIYKKKLAAAQPVIQKCKDLGGERDFCSKWCNTEGKWGCGKATDATYTCDCTGCNGCGEKKYGVYNLPTCGDFGGSRDYCSKWCNTAGKWGCGKAIDGTYTCDCTGCNGCSKDIAPKHQRVSSCKGWSCEHDGQYCPPGAHHSKPGGYCCIDGIWGGELELPGTCAETKEINNKQWRHVDTVPAQDGYGLWQINRAPCDGKLGCFNGWPTARRLAKEASNKNKCVNDQYFSNTNLYNLAEGPVGTWSEGQTSGPITANMSLNGKGCYAAKGIVIEPWPNKKSQPLNVCAWGNDGKVYKCEA